MSGDDDRKQMHELLVAMGLPEFKSRFDLEEDRLKVLLEGWEEIPLEMMELVREQRSVIFGEDEEEQVSAVVEGSRRFSSGGDEGAEAEDLKAENEAENEEDSDDGELLPELGVRGVSLSDYRRDEEEYQPADVVLASQVTRVLSHSEEMERRKESLFYARELAMMTQFRVGTQYQESVAAIGLVAQIELVLICFFRESVPDPGALWDADRRSREMSKRLARLRWVEREQDREFTGLRGVINWLAGRTRLTGKDLYYKMVVEADEMMEAIAEANRSRRRRTFTRELPAGSRSSPEEKMEDNLAYSDLDYLLEDPVDWRNMVDEDSR